MAGTGSDPDIGRGCYQPSIARMIKHVRALLPGANQHRLSIGFQSRLSAVIAHPGLADSVSGIFVVSTKRSTSSTEALLAFAVLTRDRKAA